VCEQLLGERVGLNTGDRGADVAVIGDADVDEGVDEGCCTWTLLSLTAAASSVSMRLDAPELARARVGSV
jgi:hypothetical protein